MISEGTVKVRDVLAGIPVAVCPSNTFDTVISDESIFPADASSTLPPSIFVTVTSVEVVLTLTSDTREIVSAIFAM